MLELDLAVTRDNVPVVSHDPLINPSICRGGKTGVPIHTLTLAEIQDYDCGCLPNPRFETQIPIPGTKIPTFDEVLDLGPLGTFDFNVETKIFADQPDLAPSPEEFTGLVLAAIRRHQMESRVILQSFDFRTLHAMRTMAPEIRLSALYEGADRSFVEIAREAGATIVSPEFHLVTPEQVASAHAVGLQVVPWTANSQTDWDKLIAANVDGIITDDPAALLAYLKEKKLR